MSTALTTFTLRDHLDYPWTNELVGFPIDPAWAAMPLEIVDEAGGVGPVQIGPDSRAAATGDQRPRAWFVVDHLPALGERSYRLQRASATRGAAGATPSGPTLTRGGQGGGSDGSESSDRSGGTAVLANGEIELRLPATWRPAGDAAPSAVPPPAPVLAVRTGDAAAGWIGAGRLSLSSHLTLASVDLVELDAGPLWRTVEVVYTCVGGADYRCWIRMYATGGYAEIREASTLGRASTWEFSLTPGLVPDTMVTHRNTPVDLASFAAARNAGDCGAIQLPVFSGIWVKDDYYHVTFMNRAVASGVPGIAVAFLGINGGVWDYPYENQMDVRHDSASVATSTPRAADTYMRLSLKAGHRAWVLQVTSSEAVLATTPPTDNPVWRMVRQYETPLHVVKDYVLDWDETPAASRPFAVADRAQLAHARRNATEYAPLREYVAMLDPDLPGDFTYYHAGTHRTFSDDRKNDPAVLYVAAGTDAERRKQAGFLKDVVMTGLNHRRHAILHGSHVANDCASINVGRGLRPWSALYDFAAAEGAFSDAEQRLARATFAFWCYKINDPDYWPADALTMRDDHPNSTHRTFWFPGRQSDWAFYNIDNIPHNFHGDLWSAMGCCAMVFPCHPQSRTWIDRSLEFWEHELTEWIFPEGAWLESSTYTLNSMKDYLIYCRMLANNRVRDYAVDERLQRAFRCVAEQLGPHDTRLGGNSLPVMGDGGYPNVFCYVVGWMAGLARDTAPGFARQMSAAWKGTGEYLTEPGRFGLNFVDFLFLDPAIPAEPLPTTGSKWYHGLGALLRAHERTPQEMYMFIKAGIIYSHFHEPEGTFQLWWNSMPLCDEYGVQYGKGFDGTPLGHPSCHNCVEVPGDNACYNKGDITTFVATPTFDYVVVEAPILNAYLGKDEGIWGFKGEMAPNGWHRRHFLLVKDWYLYIYDELTCTQPSVYHLNIKATEYVRDGNRVDFTGRFGTDLAFCMLDLGERTMTHDEIDTAMGHSSSFRPPEKFYHQLRLHVAGRPGEDYASVLVPHAAGSVAEVTNDPATGGARIRRDGFTERALVFPTTRDVAADGIRYHGMAGGVRESDNGDLQLLQARGNLIGVDGRLVIDGDGPFTAGLSASGRLTVEASRQSGGWLRLGDGGFAAATGKAIPGATLDGVAHSVIRLADGRLEVYMPAGNHTLVLG